MKTLQAYRSWQVAPIAFGLLMLIGCGSGSSTPAVPAAIEGSSSGQASDDAPTVTAAASVGNSPFAESRRKLPGATEADLHPKVTFKTSLGDIVVRLDAENAPITVDNFLYSYVNREFYSGTIIHYIDKGTIIMGGGFDTNSQFKEPRAPIQSEADNGLKNKRGTIAMTRSNDFAHTATSQFFFNLKDNPQFDFQSRDSAEAYGYTVFGTVVSGIEVLEKISSTPCTETEISPAQPSQAVVIHSVEVTK